MASSWIWLCLHTCPHMDPHTWRHIHIHTYTKRNKKDKEQDLPDNYRGTMMDAHGSWVSCFLSLCSFSLLPQIYHIEKQLPRATVQHRLVHGMHDVTPPNVKRLTSLVLVKWQTILLPLVWAWCPLGWSLLVPESLSCAQFDMIPPPWSHCVLSWWGTEGSLMPQSPSMCSFPWDTGTDASSLWIYESFLYRGPCGSHFDNRSCWLQVHPPHHGELLCFSSQLIPKLTYGLFAGLSTLMHF